MPLQWLADPQVVISPLLVAQHVQQRVHHSDADSEHQDGEHVPVARQQLDESALEPGNTQSDGLFRDDECQHDRGRPCERFVEQPCMADRNRHTSPLFSIGKEATTIQRYILKVNTWKTSC